MLTIAGDIRGLKPESVSNERKVRNAIRANRECGIHASLAKILGQKGHEDRCLDASLGEQRVLEVDDEDMPGPALVDQNHA